MPENAAYFQAAYAVTVIVYVLYGLSLVLRRRAIARHEATRAASRAPSGRDGA